MKDNLIKISKELITTNDYLRRYVLMRLQRNGVTEIQEEALQYMCDEINEYIDDRFNVR